MMYPLPVTHHHFPVIPNLHQRFKPPPLPTFTPPPPPRRRLTSPLSSSASAIIHDDDDDFFTVEYDPDEDDASHEGSPWEGAVVYRRDAAVHHVEYGTSLERLGLGDLSSPESRVRAAAMGILARKAPSAAAAAAEEEVTPVLVSVDVVRRRGRLRLDGIVRTVITLGCYRCAEPAPEGVFANFSLLLTEDPVEEPDIVDLGTIYEEDRAKASLSMGREGDHDDEDIDWDDRLHFPACEKEIDMSKHIRDIIHLEVSLDAFCSPNCKGLCLDCGTNLNTSNCSCSEGTSPAKEVKRQGPLKDLLKPMQKR